MSTTSCRPTSVQRLTRVELAVSLRTVRARGLTLPPTILARADAVIE